MAVRQREKEVARGRLARLVSDAPVVLGRSRRRIVQFNGEPGRPGVVRRAARTARVAGVPAGVLADRLARDQLPPVLRHQHAGRAPGRGPARVRGDPPAARRADRGGQGAGGPDRSSRRSLQSGEVLLDAAGPRRSSLEHRTRTGARRPTRAAALRASPRRSSRAGSRCRSAGRSTAPPATTTSTISTASTSTAGRRGTCVGPTPSSPATASRSTTCCIAASG